MSTAHIELQFLPAALEVEQTPPLPAVRLMLWAIIAFSAAALAWSCLSEIDIVGVAPGKIVASGRIKTVQPLETAVVKAILVAEGQHVTAGDVLVQLDPTEKAADTDRLRKERLALQLDRARLNGLLSVVSGGLSTDGRVFVAENRAPTGTATDNNPPTAINPRLGNPPREATALEIDLQDRRLTEQYAEYRSAIAALNQEAQEKRAARRAVEERIAQLDATIPLVTEETQAVAELMKKGLAPRVQWLGSERERIEQTKERDVQRNQLAVIDAELRTVEERTRITASQYRNRWMAELTDSETRLASYDEEIAKAGRRLALQTLTAPVSGTVQELAVHTVGGVVTEAQPLMQIVPDDAPIEVQAFVANKDIGFVHDGQAAVIKVETFPFTKYGTVAGSIIKVSDDAVSDEKHGLVYAARVAPARTTMRVDEKLVKLAPGMAVTVEVNMGKRRLIEFLLSPLLRYRDEAARER